MIIGVPKEVKDHETRVGLVPSGATALREAGHEVIAESHAGEGSTLSDEEYARALVKPLGSVAVRFVSIPSLIRMKEIAGRPQDKIDIDYLRKLADAGK